VTDMNYTSVIGCGCSRSIEGKSIGN